MVENLLENKKIELSLEQEEEILREDTCLGDNFLRGDSTNYGEISSQFLLCP